MNSVTDISTLTIDINTDQTKKLKDYLEENNLDSTELNEEFETLLYIDYDSIKKQQEELNNELEKASTYFGEDTSLFVNYPDSKYKDGTTLGLDKIEKAGNEIYYSNSSLPVIGSEILRSYKLNLDVSL